MTDQNSLRIQNVPGGNSINSIVDSKNGEWMTLQEASDATHMSEPTLRRYIKRGKVKFRRQGRTVNSKLEVFVTAEMRDAASVDRASTEGLEDVLSSEAEYFDANPEDAVVEHDDYAAQSNRETLDWLRERLDERDAKIEQLNKELQSANYRNGYLESQVSNANEQVKLLTDREREQSRPEPSWWSKFASWFMGKKN